MDSAISSAAVSQAEAPERQRGLSNLLLVVAGLVFAMVVVGGITRLTESGLSITEWKPIRGAIPPLTQADWQHAFDLYKQTPQFREVAGPAGMTLPGFKFIFFWEWVHRLLGRIIGLVFFVPLVYFALRGKVDRALAGRLFVIFVLGAIQGAVGWYMVKSGLVDDPRVSQYRLTAHLGLAFLIYAAMFWTALELLSAERAPPSPARRRVHAYAVGLTALIFVMVLSGGIVAGIHAGLAYNTFPLMNGHVVPPEYLTLQPWYLNLFSNIAAVQFDHRLIAWLLFLLVPWFWSRARSLPLRPRARLALNLLLLALAAQITLGISTLLLVVPVPLAAAHQAGALILFTTALWVTSELG